MPVLKVQKDRFLFDS